MAAIPIYTGPNPTAGKAAQQTPDPSLLAGTTQALLGLQGTAQSNQMNAQAETVAAAGDTAEASAYATAAQIAGGQAGVAGISGQIQQYQQQLQVQQTIGSQKASVAGAGFTESGTALDLMRSSLQQGALGSQMIGLQTTLTEMGYTAAEAAATAESTAALSAASQASILAGDYTTAANTATANETAGTTDLMNYLKTLNPSSTNLNMQLEKDLQSGNTAAVQLDINNLVVGAPTGPGNNAVEMLGPTGQLGGALGKYGTDITPANAAGLSGNPFTAVPGQELAVVGPTGAALNNPAGA